MSVLLGERAELADRTKTLVGEHLPARRHGMGLRVMRVPYGRSLRRDLTVTA